MKPMIAILIVVLAGPTALAQSVAPPPPTAPVAAMTEVLDPAALAAARDLLIATEFEAQMERAAQLNTQAVYGTLLAAAEERSGLDFPDQLEAQIRAVLAEEVGGLINEIRATALDDAARVYARYFTADEIRELQRIQTHPVMVKFQRFAPEFTTELSQIGAMAAARRLPEVQERVRQIVEAWFAQQRRHGESPRT